MPAATYTRPELYELLGLDRKAEATARRRLAQLRDRHGFPPALPGLGHVWPRASVDRWIQNTAEPPPAPRQEGAPEPEPGAPSNLPDDAQPIVLERRSALERAIMARGAGGSP